MRILHRRRDADQATIADLRRKLFEARVDAAAQSAAHSRLADRCAKATDRVTALEKQLAAAPAAVADRYVTQLEHRIDRITGAYARLRASLTTCPGHLALTDRLEQLQAANEALDVPIGLDISADNWRGAVALLAAELTVQQASAVTA
jgi:hypothetical protein